MARPQDSGEHSASISREDWPDVRPSWRNRRVMATSGYRFLGKFIVAKLPEPGLEVGVVE